SYSAESPNLRTAAIMFAASAFMSAWAVSAGLCSKVALASGDKSDQVLMVVNTISGQHFFDGNDEQ
ncbi:MAG: hypothetical protein QGF87_08145, partial [Woeseiaceae bacterium]|nr:hypothetical protein [Woeseiaceae bacterium]